MNPRIIDSLFYSLKKRNSSLSSGMFYLDTNFGTIRVFDSKGKKPVIINVPDGPNVIEHQYELLKGLSKNFRVICFEYPGLGFSYPNSNFDYRFESGAKLLIEVMELMKIDTASLIYSCSNGFYGLKAAMINPNKFNHIFLSQTPSIKCISRWTEKSVPMILKIPLIGQTANLMAKKKFASIWYNYSLPKDSTKREAFKQTASKNLKQGGCFCLSSLVQGLSIDENTSLEIENTKVTLVWGGRDFTHRHTDMNSIKEHVQSCEIIEFEESGHFPELESVDKFIRLVNERIN